MQGKPTLIDDLRMRAPLTSSILSGYNGDLMRQAADRLASYEAALREIDEATAFPGTVESLRLTVSNIARKALEDNA